MERNKTLIRLIWTVNVHARSFLRGYMPINIPLVAIQACRGGLKWGMPVTLLAIPYLLVANACSQFVEAGAADWLHLIVMWALWNMLKMLWIRPISAVLLIRTRIREIVTARRDLTALLVEADDREERALVEAIRTW